MTFIDKKTPNFNTGKFNKDRDRQVLLKVTKDLYDIGYHTLKSYADRTSKIFAYKLKDPQGFFFILVARSTKLFAKEHFGTQTWIVREARDQHIPIVLAVCPDREPRKYYAFNPEIMLEFMKGENDRLGEKMGNFSVKDGLPWDVEKVALSLIRRRLGCDKHAGDKYAEGYQRAVTSEEQLKIRLRQRGKKRSPTNFELGHRDKKTLRRKTALEKQRQAQAPFANGDEKQQARLGDF